MLYVRNRKLLIISSQKDERAFFAFYNARHAQYAIHRRFHFILFFSYSYDTTYIIENSQPTVSNRLVIALCVGNTITSRTQTQPRIFRNTLVAASVSSPPSVSDEENARVILQPIVVTLAGMHLETPFSSSPTLRTSQHPFRKVFLTMLLLDEHRRNH